MWVMCNANDQLTHDLLSLLFGCHLTLYAAIAAYKVTANPLSKINHRAYVTMILISEWPVDHLHIPSIYSIDLMVDEL